jgi:hypothetical protein
VQVQDDTATAYQSRNKEGEAKPPHGVEKKNDRKAQQRSGNSAGRCCVHTYLPPIVDKCTHYLQEQSRYKNALYEVRYAQLVHKEEARHEGHNGDEIGYHASFAVPHLMGTPTLKAPVRIDTKFGNGYGETINHNNNRRLIEERQYTHVTEYKEYHHAHQRHVEGGEDGRNPSCHTY